MNTLAPTGTPSHTPSAPLLGQLVFEPSRPKAAPGHRSSEQGGWWAFFLCHCCGDERYEPVVRLPADTPHDQLAPYAARFWSRPCLLRPFRDGFAVHPAEAGR
ncbi:hypothetical protein ACFVIM_18650 [Streptomyces sp. NPDC057638]|uniref:hypothetical protein n=1 Tax=Streptomyces sp. NPDC057638 TaxID=3346190 RepID=UPI0036B5B059